MNFLCTRSSPGLQPRSSLPFSLSAPRRSCQTWAHISGGEIHKRAMDCGFPGPILSTQTRKLCPIIQSSPKGTQPTQSPSLQGAVTLQIFHIQAAECEIGDHKTTVAFSDWQFPQFKSSWFGVLQTTKHPTISPFATAGG